MYDRFGSADARHKLSHHVPYSVVMQVRQDSGQPAQMLCDGPSHKAATSSKNRFRQLNNGFLGGWEHEIYNAQMTLGERDAGRAVIMLETATPRRCVLIRPRSQFVESLWWCTRPPTESAHRFCRGGCGRRQPQQLHTRAWPSPTYSIGFSSDMQTAATANFNDDADTIGMQLRR